MTETQPCVGCGASFPDVEGPTHRYLGASPGCWSAYGDLATRETGDFRYMSSHQLTVDAYCAQHPGTPSPQTTRSAAVHLVSLYLQLERETDVDKLYTARQRIASLAKQGELDLEWLEPPSYPGEITVLDVLGAEDPAEHESMAREWSVSVWESWSPHHATVRRWAKSL